MWRWGRVSARDLENQGRYVANKTTQNSWWSAIADSMCNCRVRCSHPNLAMCSRHTINLLTTSKVHALWITWSFSQALTVVCCRSGKIICPHVWYVGSNFKLPCLFGGGELMLFKRVSALPVRYIQHSWLLSGPWAVCFLVFRLDFSGLQPNENSNHANLFE